MRLRVCNRKAFWNQGLLFSKLVSAKARRVNPSFGCRRGNG